MKEKYLLLLIIILCFNAFAVNRDSRFDITDIGIGVRSFGLGQTFAASDSRAEGVFTNPAVLVHLSGFQLHSAVFNLTNEFNYKLMSVAFPLTGLNVGLGVVSNLSDGFTETAYLDGRVRETGSFSAGDTALALGTGMAVSLWGTDLRLGGVIKYYLQSMDQDQRTAWGADIGLQIPVVHTPDFRWESGVVVKNIWQPVFPDDNYFLDKESISSQVSMGTAFYLKDPNLLVAVDLYTDELRIGLEYFLSPDVSLRAGSAGGDLSAGIGLKLRQSYMLEFHYAYHQFQTNPLDQNPTHLVGFTYLGGVSQPVEVREFAPPPQSPPPRQSPLDRSLTLDFPKDRMITALDFVWVKGQAGADIRRVFVNGKKAYLKTTNRRFKVAIPLEKFGKNMLTIEALDRKNQRITLTKRVFRKASFVDVRGAGEQIDAILRLAECGFFSGYKDNTFHPEKPLSRAELAALLVKVKELPLSHPFGFVFADIPPEYWAAPYVAAITKARIMTPFPDKRFRPREPVPHGDAVMIVAAFDDLRPPPRVLLRSFNDLPVLHPAAPSAEIAKKVGILKGIRLLKPNKPLTRGEAALWLYRTEEVKKHLSDLNNWEKGF